MHCVDIISIYSCVATNQVIKLFSEHSTPSPVYAGLLLRSQIVVILPMSILAFLGIFQV